MRDQEKEQLLQRIHAGLRGFVNDEYRWQAAKAAAIVCLSELTKAEKEHKYLMDVIERLENYLIEVNKKNEELREKFKDLECQKF